MAHTLERRNIEHESNESGFTVRPPKGHPIYDERTLGREVGEWFRDYVAAGRDRNTEWVIPVTEVTIMVETSLRLRFRQFLSHLYLLLV